MILTCPACATRFLVADAAFGGRARRVRCGQCKTEWMAEAPDTPAHIDIIIPPEPESMPEYAAAEPRPIPQGSNLPAPLATPQPFLRRMAIAAALLLLLGLGGLFALYQEEWPRAMQAMWGGGAAQTRLAIEAVKTRYEEQAGGWILVVEGMVRNNSDDAVTLPALTLVTKDKAGAILGSYQPSVQSRTLSPGAVTGFVYSLSEVSDRLAEVTVQFAEP